MNILKNRKSTVYVGIAVLIVLIFIAGFFTGLEYQSRKVEKAIEEVTDELFSGFLGEDETVDEPEKLPKRSKLKKKVSITITDKAFIPSNYLQSRYEDYIAFDIVFTNHTDKDIRGVQGTIVFSDIFDNEIYRIDITNDNGILAQDSDTWEGGIEYNQFFDNHKKLAGTELENLTIEWSPDTIIYEDGTKETR